ncbi:hypothetical protein K1719_009536 [Acacia pycnantha]|nr:hypothetical protein K1719_009536 [Acacia pycnantha]
MARFLRFCWFIVRPDLASAVQERKILETDKLSLVVEQMLGHLRNLQILPSDAVINKLASYYIRSPAVQDIVLFRDPTKPSGDKAADIFIKRVIAKAGDLVEVVRHGSLYINRVARKEDYVAAQPTYTTNLTAQPLSPLCSCAP